MALKLTHISIPIYHKCEIVSRENWSNISHPMTWKITSVLSWPLMACSRPSRFPQRFPHRWINLSSNPSWCSPTVTVQCTAVGSTNPQNVPFSPPGDRFKIWYGDRSNLPTLLWCLQCLGLSLTGVAQYLLLLSRWTLLGYASLPSNPIESVQSLCSATFTFTSSSSSVLQTSNHKSHNVLLCNKSRTQSVLLYVLLLLWRGKFWSHLGSGLDRISTLEKLWRQSQASSIM